MPVQTSLYSASKLAGEALISPTRKASVFAPAFSASSRSSAPLHPWPRFDFCHKLGENPKILPVLGDGTARKSYLAVEDCLEAILTVFAHTRGEEEAGPKGFTHIYNLGTDEYCQVSDSIGWICAALGLKPELQFTGGDAAGSATIPLSSSTPANSQPRLNLASPSGRASRPPSPGSRPTLGFFLRNEIQAPNHRHHRRRP